MSLQQLLLPFIENVDYKIENGQVLALPKTRKVIQIISHPEIAEIEAQEGHGIIPATFDVSGNQLTPMIPAQESVSGVSYQAAWDEEIEVDETYFESIENMKLLAIKDVAFAVGEFLSDKEELLDEDDNINIVDNRIHTWNFKNIAQPSIDELFNSYRIALSKKFSLEERAAALKYLQDTDFKIIKSVELGIQVDPEILSARAAARAKLQ